MYNKGSVLLGIFIFLLLALSPIWLNLSGGKAGYKPNPVLPENYKECVAGKEFMNHYHMDMLNEWRDKVVRFDERVFLKEDGTPFLLEGKPAEMSLSHTCMKCHYNKADFCDQCHNYLDVKPYCWDCHVDPALVAKRVKPAETFLQQGEQNNPENQGGSNENQ